VPEKVLGLTTVRSLFASGSHGGLNSLDVLLCLRPVVATGEGPVELSELFGQFGGFHAPKGLANDLTGVLVPPAPDRSLDVTAQLARQCYLDRLGCHTLPSQTAGTACQSPRKEGAQPAIASMLNQPIGLRGFDPRWTSGLTLPKALHLNEPFLWSDRR